MKNKDVIYLSIIVILLIALFLLAQKLKYLQTGISSEFKANANSYNLSPEEYLKLLEDSYQDLKKFENELNALADPIPISKADAIKYNKNYLANKNLTIDSTRAVYFTLGSLIKKFMLLTGKTQISTNTTDLLNASYYVYFGIYDTAHKYKNQSTAILQLSRASNGFVYTDQIYNLGDLCPDNCPQNENIK